MDMCATAYTGKSEDNLWGSVLSFHHYEVLENGLKLLDLVTLGDRPFYHRVILLTLSHIHNLLKIRFHLHFYLFIWCVWRYACV